MLLRKNKLISEEKNDITSNDTDTVEETEKDTFSDIYIHGKNIIFRADGKPISDEEVPYLIELGKRKAIEEHSSTPHRSYRDGELSFQFSQRNSEKISIYENNIYNLSSEAVAYPGFDVDEHIRLCDKAIDVFYRFRKFCSGTKGGTFYFEDMWMFSDSSNSTPRSYIDDVEKLKNDLTNNYESYVELYRQKRTLKNDLVKTIDGNDGILQKNIYSYFHPQLKSDIQKLLRELEKENIISREKKGGSYSLHMCRNN